MPTQNYSFSSMKTLHLLALYFGALQVWFGTQSASILFAELYISYIYMGIYIYIYTHMSVGLESGTAQGGVADSGSVAFARAATLSDGEF